jgi:hypothetical protein
MPRCRRRLLLVAGVLALVLWVVGLVAWVGYARPGVTPDNGDRICQGMTPDQVQALLGKPADEAGRLDESLGPVDPEEPKSYRTWHGDGGSIHVLFDRSDRVTRAWIHGPGGWPNIRPAGYGQGWPDGTDDVQPSLLQRLRRLLPW